MQPRYRLRWRFEFNDGKPPRRGMWSCSDDIKNGAWAVNKSNLARAMIEFEDQETYKTGVFAECDGHDYCNFEWIGAAAMVGMSGGVLRPSIVGLQIRTTDLILKVYVDGSHTVEKRTEEDKKIHLVGFGR